MDRAKHALKLLCEHGTTPYFARISVYFKGLVPIRMTKNRVGRRKSYF